MSEQISIEQVTGKSSSPEVLREKIMNYSVPKSESEWWANREISRLTAELKEAREELESVKAFGEIEVDRLQQVLKREKRILKCDSASCKYVGEVMEYYSELKKLKEKL